MGVSFFFCVTLSSFHSYAVMLCRCVPAVFPPYCASQIACAIMAEKVQAGRDMVYVERLGDIEDVENAEIGV